MEIKETSIPGAYLILPQKIQDDRGFFTRTWCKKEFEVYGMETDIVQCNLSHNIKTGTLRGMHFQQFPFQEAKYVTCISGCIFDVIVDLRPDSPAYLQWFGTLLNENEFTSLYIPKGCAHGFQTQAPNSSVYYHMTEFFHPDAAAGIRWDDPKIGITWPIFDVDSITISEKDSSLPSVLDYMNKWGR